MHPSSSQLRKLAAKLFGIFLAAIACFAACYWLLGFFSGDGLKPPDGTTLNGFDYVYFSIVTISTLGYGDITPLGCSRFVASVEAVFGLAFAGYAISQVVSARQEAMIEYLAADRIAQTYDQCLSMITDAKEQIGDRRRAIQAKVQLEPMDFIYNRSNPFYPALRAIEILNAYTAHVEGIGRAGALASRVERAAHHVEELASFTRKYTNLLISAKVNWRTPRTKQILLALCDGIDAFTQSFVVHTRYETHEYKGGGYYKDIVQTLTRQIRGKV